MIRFTLAAALCLVAVFTIKAQQLPSNPDPDKCYVRTVTPDVYEVEYEDVLTYSREEAMKYAHTFLEIELTPEYSQWETTTYEGGESDDPNDCQVLCYRTYPATYDTIYKPAVDSVGNPFYREIERMFLVERGGLSSYEEIDCELTSSNILPVHFDLGSAQFSDPENAKRVLDNRLFGLLRDRPNIRIEIGAHTGSRGSESGNQRLTERRANLIASYLISRGIHRDRLVARGYGESQLKNGCADGVDCSDDEHEANRRVEFRVHNIYY
ncbi:OmpA family protein [Neolewinella aurantiaca]|uniref:OmpA family protein n=1 Tax=Neolewinella aurantiaca TaxID=2602767 RepID=A0A5C7FUY7_9BACT|nr:OmpA family protein [Neolewinella aurantiaca]TXF90430.1 OmpA family protein [Neolewinella aurantiaca]